LFNYWSNRLPLDFLNGTNTVSHILNASATSPQSLQVLTHMLKFFICLVFSGAIKDAKVNINRELALINWDDDREPPKSLRQVLCFMPNGNSASHRRVLTRESSQENIVFLWSRNDIDSINELSLRHLDVDNRRFFRLAPWTKNAK